MGSAVARTREGVLVGVGGWVFFDMKSVCWIFAQECACIHATPRSTSKTC